MFRRRHEEQESSVWVAPSWVQNNPWKVYVFFLEPSGEDSESLFVGVEPNLKKTVGLLIFLHTGVPQAGHTLEHTAEKITANA